MQTQQMLNTHPRGQSVAKTDVDLINAAFACAQTCSSCADACLGEDMVAELRECISRNIDCADICETLGRVVTRQTGGAPEVTRSLIAACREACAACAEECGQHAEMHEHCAICAEACRACERACADALASTH